MASIGKFALSGATGVQETTLALANLNVDLSVIRFEAKPEFRPIDNQLSKRRKQQAEDGRIHSTARRLAALFADDLPQAEILCKIYGLRASEIVSNPLKNPKGSVAHGPFSTHVAVDATSLWAAATSRPGSIQVHLLDCMLARQWPGAEAVSIWSELVASRKKELELRLRDEVFLRSYVTLTRVDIGISDLAEWGASARAVSYLKI